MEYVRGRRGGGGGWETKRMEMEDEEVVGPTAKSTARSRNKVCKDGMRDEM